MHRIQIRQDKKNCRQSLLPFPPSQLPLKSGVCGGYWLGLCQGRVPPQNGARRIWSGRRVRRLWTSGARTTGTWRHYGALNQVTQPRFSSFRCQLNLSRGAFAGKKGFFLTLNCVSCGIRVIRWASFSSKQEYDRPFPTWYTLLFNA